MCSSARRRPLVILGLIAILIAAGSALAADHDRSSVPLPSPSFDQPILEYERRMIQGADSGPRLTLFADGRIYVHFPKFLNRAGDYTRTLSAAETQALWTDLNRWGVPHFDALATAEAVRQSATTSARSGNVLVSPGASWAVFRVHSPDATDRPSTDGNLREFQWQGLFWSALAFPDHRSLVDLARAQERLEALLHDPRLERLEVLP